MCEILKSADCDFIVFFLEMKIHYNVTDIVIGQHNKYTTLVGKLEHCKCLTFLQLFVFFRANFLPLGYPGVQN